jgi:chemotaxis protein methyltransferase CheR
VNALSMTARDFERFQELIHRASGIHLPPVKRALLTNRLTKRVRALGLDSFREYYEAVAADVGGTEVAEMLDAVTTNETRFFREPAHFQFLAETIIPQWRTEAERQERKRHVRVWSAGCSSGEEAYSLAMVLLANLAPQGWTIEIVGSDLSTRVLERAVEGVWSLDRAVEIPTRYLKAYMLRGHGPQTGKMCATAELRSVITFERRNLIEDMADAGEFDVIFCRNVLIYFEPESRTDMLQRLLGQCAHGGYLFVGHAENLMRVDGRATVVKSTICRRTVARV